MSDAEFIPYAKLLGVEEGSWEYIWLRIGIEYAEYQYAGGKQTERQYIVQYLTGKYEAPKKIVR